MAKRLILGGHSFFSSLSAEPDMTPAEHVELVTTCLDLGITTFDTTYAGERLALGAALEACGRREEATIICWNFLDRLDENWTPSGDRPRLITPAALEQWREELRTERLDWVCIHELDEATEAEHQAQQDLCASWLEAGHISRLGIWSPGAKAASKYGANSPYSFMVTPFNVANTDAQPFEACAALGWECFACSPFVRGWDLEKMVAAGGDQPSQEGAESLIADRMLRFSLHQPFVHGLVTATRRVEWVGVNLESAARGPLSAEERGELLRLARSASL